MSESEAMDVDRLLEISDELLEEAEKAESDKAEQRLKAAARATKEGLNYERDPDYNPWRAPEG